MTGKTRRTPPDARATALFTLEAFERSGAWSDEYLNEAIRRNRLSARDAALAVRLTGGVLQNRALCDFYIAHFSTTPPAGMERRVLCILRLGVYQLLFLDKIPESAAVNEAVNQVRVYAGPRAAGLVNGVLRAVARAKGAPPEPVCATAEETLSLRHSHPLWFVREMCLALGEEGAAALLAADNAPATPLCAQVNTLKTSAAALLEALRAEGAEAAAHPWLPDALLLTRTGEPSRLRAWREGLFYIQDAAARLAAEAAAPAPGRLVLDACAAPGGKSFAAALAMKNEGRVIACDIHARKLALLREGAKRLGISCVETETLDGRVYRPEWDGLFDAVLADAPCSGLGVIRKKPDIRYKDPDALAKLPEVQLSLLQNLSRYVKPGGVLLYATCTVLRRENEDVVAQFLAERHDFYLRPFSLPPPVGSAAEGAITLWPHVHGTDGFFIARMGRQA